LAVPRALIQPRGIAIQLLHILPRFVSCDYGRYVVSATGLPYNAR